MLEGSAATARVYSWAALSHCWADSYSMPRLKFLSPFLASAVIGSNNKLKVRTKEISVRVRISFLMTIVYRDVVGCSDVIMPLWRIRCNIRDYSLTREPQN